MWATALLSALCASADGAAVRMNRVLAVARQAPDAGSAPAPSPAVAGPQNAMSAVLPAERPGQPCFSVDRPVDALACQELGEGILRVDKTSTKVNCTVLTWIDSSPKGCRCILERQTATWLTCPFDCSERGGPACVAGAARQLGMTGLTASRPQAPPTPLLPSSPEEEEAEQLKNPFTEETVCTYWQWTSWYDGPDSSTPVADEDNNKTRDEMKAVLEAATAQGKEVVVQVVTNVTARAEQHGKDVLQALLLSAPPAFELPPSLAGPAPAPAPAPAVQLETYAGLSSAQ